MRLFSNAFAWRLVTLGFVILMLIMGITYSVAAHDNAPSTPSGYKLPFDPNRLAKITAGPNMGRHGVDSCCLRSREAIDFVYVSSDQWSAIRAAKGGTVIYADDPQSGGYGRTVIIQHSDGFFSYYEHLASITANILNTTVSNGYQIGVIGKSGTSAIHLHFEVRDGVQTSPLVVGSGDSRGHSIIHSNKFYKRIGLFPWYPNQNMNSGFISRSTSHAVGVCVDNHTLVLKWLSPSEFDHTDMDGTNRFQGYDWEVDSSGSTVPSGTLEEGSENINGVTYSDMPDGNWWFHMRAYSMQYGWAPDNSVSHLAPFKIGSGPGCQSIVPESDWLADPE